MVNTVSELITAIQALPPTSVVKVDGITIQTVKVDGNGIVQISILPSSVEAD